jgi:hypothetical protein
VFGDPTKCPFAKMTSGSIPFFVGRVYML